MNHRNYTEIQQDEWTEFVQSVAIETIIYDIYCTNGYNISILEWTADYGTRGFPEICENVRNQRKTGQKLSQ